MVGEGDGLDGFEVASPGVVLTPVFVSNLRVARHLDGLSYTLFSEEERKCLLFEEL